MKILGKLDHKSPADPTQAPPFKSKSISLPLSPTLLFKLEGCLASLRGCLCTWAKLGKRSRRQSAWLLTMTKFDKRKICFTQ